MRPNRHLNLFQRLANRVGRPYGVLPFALAWEPDQGSDNRSAIFDAILRKNVWQSTESVSGPGSELGQTARYRRDLIVWLLRNHIQSMFDAPCGDLNWMGEVLDRVQLDYIGGDVSAEVVAAAKARFPKLDLRQFDICEDEFPAADVWHCRDTLMHLSFSDIWRALHNAAAADIRYALLTSHRARFLRNQDIATGGVRPLDLERAPFNFPPPTEYLRDFPGKRFPRAVGVWPMEVVREVIG